MSLLVFGSDRIYAQDNRGVGGEGSQEAASVQSEVMPEGCIRETWEIASKCMDRNIRVAVLRPSDALAIADDRQLPVLFALHGRGASYLTFTDMKPLREFMVAHPMLLVSFDADKDSAYIDATRRPQSLFTKFFFDELLPEISKRYPTNGELAITGFSMGGYGAFHYLLQRPEAFTSVSAMSGAFDLFDRGPETQKWREWTESLIGPYDNDPDSHEQAMIASNLERCITQGKRIPRCSYCAAPRTG